jgi:intracellular multiplication protein IcmL
MTSSASDSGNKPKAPEAKSPNPNVIFSRSMLHGNPLYSTFMYIALVLTVIAMALFAWDIYARTDKPFPPFFAVGSDDKLTRMTALRAPNFTTQALLDWAAEAATAVYTFDFYNYAEVIKRARIYFTEPGYENFLAAIQGAQVVNTIVKKKLVVSAVLTDTPVILKEGVISTGNYAWQVQFPMLLTYQSASEQIKSRIILTLLVTRIPTSESVKGVGIASFVVTESGPAT